MSLSLRTLGGVRRRRAQVSTATQRNSAEYVEPPSYGHGLLVRGIHPLTKSAGGGCMRSSTGPESPNTNWMVQHPLLTITSLAQLRQQDPAGGQPGGFRPGIDGHLGPPGHGDGAHAAAFPFQNQIGRASCRERGYFSVPRS